MKRLLFLLTLFVVLGMQAQQHVMTVDVSKPTARINGQPLQAVPLTEPPVLCRYWQEVWQRLSFLYLDYPKIRGGGIRMAVSCHFLHGAS